MLGYRHRPRISQRPTRLSPRYPTCNMTINPELSTASVKRQILKQLDSLKQEDERLYNILAIDVWALAKTMDEYQPGFWGAFMKNRDEALKRYLREMAKNNSVNTQRPPFLH